MVNNIEYEYPNILGKVRMINAKVVHQFTGQISTKASRLEGAKNNNFVPRRSFA